MATYALTVSTNALGLGVISGATVVVERKRTTVNDIYPTSSLCTKKSATNVSGIAEIQLEADDGTVFHEIKIFDVSGILVYKNTIQMPPQDVALDLLPLEDIISASAYQAVQAKDAAQTSATNAANSAASAATSATNASNSASAASTSATNAGNSASAASTSATNAAISEANALTYKTDAESARDAAIIGADVYVDEPTGRAAVANGVAFKVQGTGDVAAYEYRRVDASSSTLIAAYPSLQAIQKLPLEVVNEAAYLNGDESVYSIVDSNNRSLLSFKLDGTLLAKLALSVANGLTLTNNNSSYVISLDSAFINKSYDNSGNGLYSLVDSSNRQIMFIANDGTLTVKLNLSANNGLAVERLSSGAYQYSLDTSKLNFTDGNSDYIYGIVDGNNRLLFGITNDGTMSGKFVSQEIITARGGQTDLNTRLSRNITDYGLPSEYIWGEWFLRETRMRLRKRAMSESVQFCVAFIGDSWTHNRDRYSNPVASALKTSFGDAGAGWTGFAWGFGGTSNAWSGGNGNINSSDVSVALTTGWTVAYYTTASPDLGGISTATAGSKATVNYTGSGNASAVVLFYTAGSGVLRYRWNGGAWTTLDISTGSGTQTASLASVPTGTWTLEIENVSGTTVVHGIDVQKTSSGVRIHKLGSTGSSSANWTGVNATQWQNALSALAPNLVTILLGTNDQGASMTPATYATNLQTLITRIKTALPYVDIAILMPCENQRTNNTYAMSLYAYEAYKLASINKCAFLDLQYVFGDNEADYAYGTGRPWFAADLIHPDPTTGGRVITDAVYRLLTTK